MLVLHVVFLLLCSWLAIAEGVPPIGHYINLIAAIFNGYHVMRELDLYEVLY